MTQQALKIFDELKKLDWNNDDEIIDYYESHSLFFSKSDKLPDPDALATAVNVTLRYGYALHYKSYYKRVFNTVRHANKLIRKLSPAHPKYNDFVYDALYLEARTLNLMHKFREAYPIFKYLCQQDPENYNYRKWFIDTKIGLYKWILNIFIGIGFTFVLLDIALIFFESIQPPVDLGTAGVGIMVSSLIIFWGVGKFMMSKNDL